MRFFHWKLEICGIDAISKYILNSTQLDVDVRQRFWLTTDPATVYDTCSFGNEISAVKRALEADDAKVLIF